MKETIKQLEKEIKGKEGISQEEHNLILEYGKIVGKKIKHPLELGDLQLERIVFFIRKAKLQILQEVCKELKHAGKILINNYIFQKNDRVPKRDEELYKNYMVGIYNRFDELGLIYSSIKGISFNDSIKELGVSPYFEELKELLKKFQGN